ncbi:MAG: hypothetical protein WCA78_16025 [Rhizomicrobium sp.]
MSAKSLLQSMFLNAVRRSRRCGKLLSDAVAHNLTRLKLSISHRILWMRRVAGEEQGFALLIVIIAVITLSLMMGAVMIATQNYARETASRLTVVQLNAALDAGIATISHDLSDEGQQNGVKLDAPKTIQVGTVSVSISVRPEIAKVDINQAGPQLIEQLLRASGLERAYSQRIASEIADWRDRDSKVRPHGAEASDYLAAERGYVPPKHDFEAVSELALLLHGNGDLVACLAPDITIFTRSGDVDLATASARVRQAVTVITPSSSIQSSLISDSIVGGPASRPDLYEVTETAKDEASQMILTRQVVLRLTGGSRGSAWILSSISPAPTEADATAACDRLKKASTN